MQAGAVCGWLILKPLDFLQLIIPKFGIVQLFPFLFRSVEFCGITLFVWLLVDVEFNQAFTLNIGA
jgi:hypothetical protein